MKAREWGIPIVHVSWLWEVISRGSDEVDIDLWCDNPSSTHPLAHVSHPQISSDTLQMKPAVARNPMREMILVVLP